MGSTIFVTGATGNVGSEIVKVLKGQGAVVRAGDLRADVIAQRFGSGVDAAVFDFERPETYSALDGASRMFLMRPPAISNVKKAIFPAIEAAKSAGVKHIVFLSLVGVEKNRVVPHYKIEKYVMASGLNYTFLRASFFMQNLSTTHRAEIKERNEIFVPVGKGKTSFIDVRDIAAVAARALMEDGHANQAYDLTGSEALDYYEVAHLFTEILGRKIIYRNPSILQFVLDARRQDLPLPFVLVMAGLYTSTRFGMAAQVTRDVPRLLGREPISLRKFIEDHKECWL